MQTRRKFIYSAGTLGAAIASYSVYKFLPEHREAPVSRADLPDEWIWVGHSNGKDRRQMASEDQAAALIGANPARSETRMIPVRFFAHNVEISPVVPNLAVATMKWGNPGAVVDLEKQKVIQKLTAPEGVQFFGHSGWSADGKFFYCSANEYSSQQGYLLVYSAENFSLEGRIKLTGTRPHQLRPSEVAGEFIVMNETCSKECARVDFVDVARGVVTKTWDIPEPHFYHFAYSKEQKRIWAGGFLGTHTDMGASLFETIADNKPKAIEIPNVDSHVVKGENLSLNLGKVDGVEVVAFTVSYGQFFGLYDIKEEKYLKTFTEIAAPKGIDFSKKDLNIMYVSDATGAIHVYDTQKRAFAEKTTMKFGNGSHLTVV